MNINEAWFAAHNSNPDLPARIQAQETAPDPVAEWLSPRDYYRTLDDEAIHEDNDIPCHYCGKSPAHRIPTETDPVCAGCASVWDRKEIDDESE